MDREAKTLLHYKLAGEHQPWKRSQRKFLRLPNMGEYVAVDRNETLYKVTLVVHCPFDSKYVAEIYAVEIDHMAILRSASSANKRRSTDTTNAYNRVYTK
jgi:hypothetical protein